jgi:two-component system chemotaxis response regulator CheY
MGKRILVVDDAIISRAMLKKILSEAGHEVIGEAHNGAEAIARYKELQPDIVTMDITMPKMNGIEALREIRKLDPGAVVIMCTAMGQKYLVLEAMEAGATNFVVKPYERDVVLGAINNIVPRSK